MFEQWDYKRARIEVFLEVEPGSPTQDFIDNADRDFVFREPRSLNLSEQLDLLGVQSGRYNIWNYAQKNRIAIADVNLDDVQRSNPIIISWDPMIFRLAHEAMDQRQPSETQPSETQTSETQPS